jgi:hypothetical protein
MGGNVTILNQSASFVDASMLAKKYGGELPSLEELMSWLKNKNNFKMALGESYWLREEPGLEVSGYCKIDYDQGTIEEVSQAEYNSLPFESKIWVDSGDGPLTLKVVELCLILDAHDLPDKKARVAYMSKEPQQKTTAPLINPFKINFGSLIKI